MWAFLSQFRYGAINQNVNNLLWRFCWILKKNGIKIQVLIQYYDNKLSLKNSSKLFSKNLSELCVLTPSWRLDFERKSFPCSPVVSSHKHSYKSMNPDVLSLAVAHRLQTLTHFSISRPSLKKSMYGVTPSSRKSSRPIEPSGFMDSPVKNCTKEEFGQRENDKSRAVTFRVQSYSGYDLVSLVATSKGVLRSSSLYGHRYH